MSKREEKIPEPMLRLLVLRRLNCKYPDAMDYKALRALMKAKANCSPRELIRALTYLNEKSYVEGTLVHLGAASFYSVQSGVRITAEGIDYLEKLEEDVKLKIEEKEKEIGF